VSFFSLFQRNFLTAAKPLLCRCLAVTYPMYDIVQCFREILSICSSLESATVKELRFAGILQE
jgi:hypothetical protein